ncbi:type II secretion system inner membrane protein GspF [Variovorax sp. AFSI2.2]|uniref:type II secretion system inner membrane protein GspF n=1 Tax=Variovorax sp. AFSI2.2 TaxID=3384160 RepID=UPI003EC13E2E
MKAFRYQAIDASGTRVAGTQEADSAPQLRTALREKGLLPVSVDEAGAPASAAGGHRGRIPARALFLLTQQWASLLRAGLNVDASLVTLAGQVDKPAHALIINAVRNEVRAGHSLAHALAMHPRTFPPLYIALIRAGETAGELSEVMSRLADYLAESQSLRSKTLEAMIYPLVMLVVALAVVGVLLAYVVPQVVTVFENQRQTLPLLTRALLSVSAGVREGGGYALGAAMLAAVWWRNAMKKYGFRRAVDTRLLQFPVLGKLMRSADTARFASTLAILVRSGVPLLLALEAGKGLLERLPLKEIVGEALQEVNAGKSLSRALRRKEGFPPLLINLIASGEQSGQLAEMLAQAARLEQMSLEHDVTILVRLLEPLMILVMGGMVLLIVLAIMQPIFNINQVLM